MIKSILVTGGSGFIGSFLVEKLLEKGENVIVFDKLPFHEAHNLNSVRGNKDLEYIRGDITDINQLKAVISNSVKSIYHLSAVVGIKNYIENPLNVINVNLIGTKNVLELALIYGIKVLFTSTSEIYGNNPKIPWAEDDDRVLGSTNIDRWCYSSSKALGEHMVLAMHKSHLLPVSIVRYFNIYGPRQNPILVISQTIKKVLNGEKPLLYDSGKQIRCFTFIEDAIEATIRVSDSSKANGEIYNIGNNTESSILEAISLICESAGVLLEYENIDTKKLYEGNYQDIIRRVPDVNKIKKDLDWHASTSLQEGIQRTIDWARTNDRWLNL